VGVPEKLINFSNSWKGRKIVQGRTETETGTGRKNNKKKREKKRGKK
jgi:hypothetical protein